MKTFFVLIALSASLSAFAAKSSSKVQFIKPEDNQTVPQKFEVHFGVEDMRVAKAGEIKKGTGHHHLILNGKPIKKGEVIPSDASHKHFGDGATSTLVNLPPGKHTLTLQFADGAHRSYGEEYAKTITVEVK